MQPTSSLDTIAWEILSQETVQTSATTWTKTSRKEYREILRHLNVTSYSQLEEFHRCPRKFFIQKQQAGLSLPQIETAPNVDFAFGHSVGAGVQSYVAYRDTDKAMLSTVLAWNAGISDNIKRTKKSLYSAMIAVEKFIAGYEAGELLEDWEILRLPGGEPALETRFSVHCNNGFKHYCHMDLGLRNRQSGRVGVCDVKTTGFDQPEEAIYGNSDQSLSYSIMLQRALEGEDIVNYDVMYLVYSSPEREWNLLEFPKTLLDQAEYIKDLLLTQEQIRTYNDLRFFPKRGQACFDFKRRCEFYGECNLVNDEPLPEIEQDREAEPPDFVIDLGEVIENLKARKKERSK